MLSLPQVRVFGVIRVFAIAVCALGLCAAPAAGQWTVKTAMPYPAGQAALVRGNDGRFFLFGGWSSNPPSAVKNKKLQVYDPRTDTWSLRQDMPVYSWGDTALVAPDGKIHLFNAYSARVYVYDPASDTWPVNIAASWIAYAARACTAPDGRCFIFGGELPASLTYEYFPGTYSIQPRAEVPYSPEPTNRSIRFPGVYIADSESIYVIGGLPNLMPHYPPLDDVAEYHPADDSWSQGFEPMPTARAGFGCVRGWNGFLYAIGGSDVYNMQLPPAFDVVEYYDPVADGWHTGPALPEGRRECVAGIDDNGVIYLFGGCGPDKLYKNTVYALDTRVGIEGPAPADFDRDGDVDQEDFGLLQRCYSGSDQPQTDSACQPAVLDNDDDVDLGDLAVFRGCFSGPDVRADPHCAD